MRWSLADAAWAAAPSLEDGPRHPEYGAVGWALPWGKAVLATAFRRHPVRLWTEQRAMFIAATQNQDYSLRGFSTLPKRQSRQLPSLAGMSNVAVMALAAARWLDPGKGLGHDDLLATASRTLVRASAALERIRPKVLVVASQQSTVARSWVLAAHRLRIPSVYFPHAPVSDAGYYRDLPTSFAGLRGHAEVELYAQWGGDRAAMATVGNASMPDMPKLERLDPHTILLALSPHHHSAVSQTIGMLAKADLAGVTVAPHPRSDRRDICRMLPAQWKLTPDGERTFAAIMRGPASVVVDGSGVALEALYMGVPVVCIGAAASAPYPFLRCPLVKFVTGPSELRSALLELRRTVDDVERRNALRTHACSWISATGSKASALAWELIGTASASGYRGPVLDKYCMPG